MLSGHALILSAALALQACSKTPTPDEIGQAYTQWTEISGTTAPSANSTGKYSTTAGEIERTGSSGVANLPAKDSNSTSFAVNLETLVYSQYRYAVVYGESSCTEGSFSGWTVSTKPITIADQEADGQRKICLIARDIYGHETSMEYGWTKDTQAPATSISEGSLTSLDAMTLQVTAVGATGYRYAYAVNATDCSGALYSDWQAMDQSLSVPFTEPGLQRVCVQTVDAAGNLSAATTRMRPYAVLQGAPEPYSNDAALNITVTGQDVSQYRYAFLSGSSCDGVTYSSWLNAATRITDATGADGTKSLCIQTMTTEGALQPLPTHHSWVNDSQPPASPTLSGSPSDPSSAASLSIAVSGSDVHEFQWSLLTGAADCSTALYGSWTPVSQNLTTATGIDGLKRLCVRSRDRAENVQTVVTSWSWTQDTTPPTTSLSGTPNTVSLASSLNVTVGSAAGDAVSYRYAVVNGTSCAAASYSSWIAIATHITDALGADGSKILCVITQDGLGNATPAASTYAWTKDTTAPTSALSGYPSGTSNVTSISVSITDSDTYEYKYDLTTSANCTAASYSAFRSAATVISETLSSDATYRLCVVGRDQVGNEQASATEVSWTKDTTAPAAGALTLTGTPAASDNITTLAVTVNGADVSHYKFKVGVAASTSCSNATGYSAEIVRSTGISSSISGLADGSLRLCVYGRDAAGNYQALTDAQDYSWTKDTTAPQAASVSLSSLPANPSQAIALNVGVSGDGSTHYKHKVGLASSTDCSVSAGYGSETAIGSNILDNISALADGTIKLCVITRDAVGNWMSMSAAKSYSWFKDAHDPVPGGAGAISVESLDLGSLTLDWELATDVDSATPQASLTYKVYRSTSANVNTLDNMDACETATTCTVVQNFTANISSLALTGLSSNTQYYFNVRVKDNIGRQAIYTMLGQRTPPAVHIAYKDTTNSRIKYARTVTSASTFTLEVAEATVSDTLALGIDGNKKAHISYRNGTELRYLTNTSNAWVATTVDSGYAQSNTDIALDSSNYPHIIFYRFDSNKDWKHTFFNGTAWMATPDKVWNGNGSAIKGHSGSLVIDSSDKIHAVGYDASSFDLISNTNAGGSWTNTNMAIVDGTGDVGAYTAAARDSSNNIYVAYYDTTNSDLKYVKKTGTTWGTPETRDSTGSVGQYPGIAVGSNGHIHIVYYDVTNTNLKYVCHNGTAWQSAIVVDGASTDAGKSAAIVADLGGSVHVSYYDATNGDVKYAKGSCGGSWTTAVIDSTGDVGLVTDIAIDR